MLELDGSFDEISNAIYAHTPYFHSTNLETIEKELSVSEKEHHSKTSIAVLWKFWIVQHQKYITTPKYTAMKMDDFLDLYPLPTNLKEVECKSVGRTFHFLHSLHPETINSVV